MFRTFITAALILISGLTFANNALLEKPSDLSDKFRSAHQSNDYQAISDLINWNGVRKPMKKKIEVYTTSTFGLKITGIDIEEVAEDDFKTFKIGKKVLNPNTPVSHMMKIHFDVAPENVDAGTNDTAVYLLGKKEDSFIISVYTKARSDQH